jgi:hypothetical protein
MISSTSVCQLGAIGCCWFGEVLTSTESSGICDSLATLVTFHLIRIIMTAPACFESTCFCEGEEMPVPVSMRHALAALAVSLTLSSAALADQVALKNGDRISGAIVNSDGKVLTLKSDFAGDVKIQWDAITSITSTQNLHLALKDGQTLVGAVTTTDSHLTVATKSSGDVTAPMADVTSIRNDAEEAIYEKTVLHPGLADLWSGVVDTGLSLTRGNSDTLNFTFSGKAARISSRDKISVYTTAIYSNNSTTGTSEVTAHDIQGGIRGDLNVSNRIFAFAMADFEYDQFQNLNLRSVFGGGMGYHVIKHANTTFDVNVGGAYENESFSTPLTRTSGEIILGEAFATKIGPRVTLSEDFSLYPDISQSGQYRFTFDATAATRLKNWLSWQVTYSDRFLTNPVPGTLKNDAIFTTGIRVSFGKAVF